MSHYEEALMFDCVANGCVEPHRDNGKILPLFENDQEKPMRLQPSKVNNHAVTRVRRFIGDWEFVR